ncbi:MAG: energy-coupling factor transporter transmembrane component T family protein [Roseiflexaceae bacterium]
MSNHYDTLHPLTKLTWAFTLVVYTYNMNSLTGNVLLFTITIITTCVSAKRSTILRLFPLLFIPITLSVILIRGFFLPDVHTSMYELFGLSLSLDALANASIIVFRYCTLIAALLTVFQTTPISSMTQALAERGLPRSIEYILLMALQIIPDMQTRAGAILEAQQSRGLVIRSLPSRIRALLPLVGPLIVGALVDVEERAMALELRAFAAPNPPTRMQELIDSRRQHVARSALLIGMLVIIGVRIWGGGQ